MDVFRYKILLLHKQRNELRYYKLIHIVIDIFP